MKSKAHWGYDERFMVACEAELTVHPHELQEKPGKAIWNEGVCSGFYILAPEEDGEGGAMQIALDLLYVDPDRMGEGLGRLLFKEAVSQAKSMGATAITVVADPHAVAFYEHMGAIPIGKVPSGSIPGRTLPLLRLGL